MIVKYVLDECPLCTVSVSYYTGLWPMIVKYVLGECPLCTVSVSYYTGLWPMIVLFPFFVNLHLQLLPNYGRVIR